jgi:hypothetical protein
VGDLLRVLTSRVLLGVLRTGVLLGVLATRIVGPVDDFSLAGRLTLPASFLFAQIVQQTAGFLLLHFLHQFNGKGCSKD